MAIEFKLPDLGEGIHEAEILEVKVKVGDQVKEDQPIFEVETDKAVVEIPCPVAGRVEQILVKKGDTVKVGTVMITFAGAAPAGPEPHPSGRRSLSRPGQAKDRCRPRLQPDAWPASLESTFARCRARARRAGCWPTTCAPSPAAAPAGGKRRRGASPNASRRSPSRRSRSRRSRPSCRGSSVGGRWSACPCDPCGGR